MRGVATWPCDEINYIWRHGNVRYPSDELTPERARPEVVRSIRWQFDWMGRRYGAYAVLEKTCANSLRVPFVDAAVPDARYLLIRRDGVDAVGSAMKRWKAALDSPYLAQKARFVPMSDLPYDGGRYLWNRIYRLFSREERLACALAATVGWHGVAAGGAFPGRGVCAPMAAMRGFGRCGVCRHATGALAGGGLRGFCTSAGGRGGACACVPWH